MPTEETVALAARGLGQGPDPAVVPIPSEFRKVAGGGVGETRILRPSVTPPPAGWRANEPAGYVTAIDENWGSYPDETWVHTGAAEGNATTSYPTALGPWAPMQITYLSQSQLRSDSNGPVSGGKMYRQEAFVGFLDGQDIGRIVWAGLDSGTLGPGGFYCTYALRLSSGWTQSTSEAFSPKHIMFRTTQAGGAAFWGWMGWRNHASGSMQAGARCDVPNLSRYNLPIVNEGASLFERNEWVTFELNVTFNTGGAAGTPNTGNGRMWMNGVLIAEALNQDWPIDSVRSCRPACVYGGGIGNVTINQWVDTDHIYMSGPTP